jgi:hypothetical protein
MKKSIIKGYYSPDIEFGIHSPFDKEDFGFLLQIFVGLADEHGEECFEVFVCTTKWIENNYDKQTILIGLHTIIVREYNYERITKAIEELFCIEGTTWDNISCDLSYYGLSEMDHKRWASHNYSINCGVISSSDRTVDSALVPVKK